MIKSIFLFIIFSANYFAQINSENHSEFTSILSAYVHDGLVDYTNLKNDRHLIDYIEELGNTNPDEIIDIHDRLAFWINAYNAFTLKIIIDEYPVESINDLHWGGLYLGTVLGTTVWDDDDIIIDGKNYSLNNIEHDIIRKEFDEEKIHFALVCASIGCPQLREEAYEGYKLQNQLEEQAVKFFSDSTKNYFNLNTRTAYLSKILDWYRDDFASDDEELLFYISSFTDEKTAGDLKQNAAVWKIEYLDYNWNLNEFHRHNISPAGNQVITNPE